MPVTRLSTQARIALTTLAVAAAVTFAAVLGAGWWAQERALKAGEEALRHSVLLLDRSVDRAMNSLNFLTNELIYDLQHYGDGDTDADGYLAVQVATAQHVVLAEIVDSTGLVVAASDDARLGRLRRDLLDAVPSVPTLAAHAGQVTIGLATPSGEADDPLGDATDLIAVNIAAAGLTGTLYLEPAFFDEAIAGTTTWKNQTADLFQADGTPMTRGRLAWNRALRDLTHGDSVGLQNQYAPPSQTLRSNNWLIAHRWLPDLGIHVATAVPKSTVLIGWQNDLLVAGSIGLATLLVLGVLTLSTMHIDRRNSANEAALKGVTERLNLAFEGSNDGVWDWDTNADVAYYSPRWCSLLGYGSQDIAPKPQSWMDLLHPEDKQAVCSAIQQHLDGTTPVYSAVHRMQRKGGGWLWVESRGKALRAPDGHAYRMVGTMTDIEEKKRQEIALLAARDEAEAANRSKSEFLAVMSHEIRTPMTGVLGMAQVLLTTALTTKQRRFADLIKSSGESLLAILNDILDFSKLEAGHLKLETLDFLLNDEIDAVMRLMELPAQAKRVSLHLDDRTDGRVALRGDPTRIRQILMNLIGNAIKFTEDGSVTLRCRVHPRAAGRWEVNFEVIDTGIGMTEEVRRSLFQKFNQGDASIARRYGGTGLGLAICHQLTTLMDGTIKVESQANVGSRFCVSINLPKANATPRAAIDQLPASKRPDLADLRVLAAEDNAINQILLHELLAPYVAVLDIVDDGEAAIDAATRGDYDVVLMDVRLPGIDGVAASREIRGLGGVWTTRPIIALTANAMSEQHAAYIEAGMTACLSKPIDCERLYATLSGIAAGSQSHATLEDAKMADGSFVATPHRTPTPDHAREADEEFPLLSQDGLGQLVAIIGGESVAGLLQQLAQQLEESMRQLDEAAGQPTLLSAIAHTLAGAAGNCQAVRASKAARALEHAISCGESPADPISALRRAVTDTLPAIAATIDQLHADATPATRRYAAQ
ncbi:MAG: ATP-binding protein [Alphaproteobacteria bacterium]